MAMGLDVLVQHEITMKANADQHATAIKRMEAAALSREKEAERRRDQLLKEQKALMEKGQTDAANAFNARIAYLNKTKDDAEAANQIVINQLRTNATNQTNGYNHQLEQLLAHIRALESRPPQQVPSDSICLLHIHPTYALSVRLEL
jgi:hypothetical protein